jgi:hypothetical protein
MPTTTEPTTIEPSLGRRLAWFFGIAAASALVCALVAEALRWLILH